MRTRPGDWRCGNRDCRGRVRTNEITLSRGARCSGRGRARGGAHTATRMHTWPGDWRCGNQDHCGRVRVNEITLSRGARCSGRGCARGGTHGDTNVHAAGCLAILCRSAFSMKNRLEQIFVSVPPAPMIGPFHATDLIFKNEHMHIRVSVRVPLRAPPPAAARAPAEGYFIHANPSATVPVAASPITQPRAHSRRCACPPARAPSRCSAWPR